MSLRDTFKKVKRRIATPNTPEAIWEWMTDKEREANGGTREKFLERMEMFRVLSTHPAFTLEGAKQGFGVTGKVICGFPGVGKSTLFKELKDSDYKVLDSDSSTFDKAEFPDNYIKHIKEKTAEGYTILASSHDVVRDALIKNEMLFTLVYPDKSLKDEYLERYKERGSPQKFIDLLDSKWDEWIGQCDDLKNDYCRKVKLDAGEYVNVEKVGIVKPAEKLKEEAEARRVKSQDTMIGEMNKKLAAHDENVKLYKKSGTFKARNGKPGEHVVTEIDGEKETEKTVKDGEVVIKGPKGEMYVVSTKKFNDRYEVDKELTDEFQDYKAKGLIYAYEYKGPTFKFRASWDEDMLCKEGDFLACPVTDPEEAIAGEVYRIERGVFDDTYKPADLNEERNKYEGLS